LLAPPGLAVLKSRYVDRHLSSSYHPQQRAVDLQNLLSTQKSAFDWVIIGDEPTLAAVAEYQGQDWLDGWFPVDHRSSADIDAMLCKRAFYEVAAPAGLRMPFSSICQGWDQVLAAVESAGYPVMLKAGVGMSGSGVFKVHDDAELEPAYAALIEMDSTMLVQRFHHGQVGSTDVLFDHGLPVCWQSSYSLMCWPTPLASSSARQFVLHPDVIDILTKVGQVTGFHGFAGVDWIQDRESGHLYVLEINPRPTPSYHLDRYSGVSFSSSLNRLLSAQRQSVEQATQQPVQQSGLIRLFPQNLYWSLSERNLPGFLHCWRDAPWHDPLLLCAYLRRVLTHYLPRYWLQKLKSWLRKEKSSRQGSQ
jgi:predicted ATP-grasp superfamily ATP-dependent carboligase